ncbi:DUF3617 family protein [Diaphorobacter aerolatus]|uniref:DUF3617 family protein n=1 Tax=Diaphorobacter aerolatus TaxID=1288495 RepID=A0A7H0GG01_9BURK|nr:DUF3617 family protein [Diaphorobacter aerolatus]QNP47217.1 hypothetical protein H9K75_12540 [Diaphorobacter aerolatus]
MRAPSFSASGLFLLAALTLAGFSPSAQAARPGAFEVTETKSAIGNKPAKPPRVKNRCFVKEQVDKDGFLYPDQLLSQQFKQCRITQSQLVNKNRKEWTVQCGSMLTAEAHQVNAGANFQLHIDARLLGGAMKQTIDYSAKALKRACVEEDSRLE